MSGIKYFLLLIFVTGGAIMPASGQDTRQYDDRIDKIINKIQQYPERTKDLGELRENFEKANETDSIHVISLLQTGQPDIWLGIYKTYLRLDKRQQKVMIIPEKSLKLSGIKIKDYNRNLKDSKYKALAYHYAHGEKLLNSGDQAEARLAYMDFLKVADLDPSFKELDKMLRTSILKGSTYVEFELNNLTGRKISNSMVDKLTIIIWELKKAKYGQVKPDTIDDSFTFVLRVVLDELLVGSDQYKEVQYQEERDIYIGGLVVETISCQITETRQLKKALLAGSIEYIDKQTGRVVNRVPIKVESIFSNAYASLQGNPDAAGDATRELLRSKKADYPSAEQMVLDATEEFTKKARGVILAE